MAETTRSFKRLGVVGAGNMGSGIAQKMAAEGFDVTLVDVDDEKVARGMRIIEKTLGEGVDRKILTAEAARAITGRIHGTSQFEDLTSADLVVEAVFEDLGIKKDVFARLDQLCRPDTILATNTSSFAVADLAAATRRPERVLGLHYFYHPAKNRLVEVVAGARTDPRQCRRAWALQEALGKTPITSRDSYGFIVNRFFAPWLTEAVRLLEEGAAGIATIEDAAKQAFGIGMGPFELMNVTGLPIALHTATTLGRAFGPVYEPPELLRSQVESGRPWSLSGSPDPTQFTPVADRLAAAAFYVAAALVDEGVGSIEDTDIGARVGLRWRRGPFEMMNSRGIEPTLEIVSKFAAKWSLAIPRTVTEQARAGRPFSLSVVRSTIDNGIATLTINRPDAMNALNEAVIAQLADALRRIAADPTVKGIAITGSGKAFVAGADIRFFVRNIESGDVDRIVRFTQRGHDLLRDIAACPKPVVARLNGLALGGGVELALACHAIVASANASLAFPETGIGIYPGLGGTQRTPRRIGRGLAKWLVLTGHTLKAEDALAIGLVDRVVRHEHLDDAVAEAVAELAGRTEPQSALHPAPRAVPESYRGVAEFFERHDVEMLRQGRADSHGDPRLVKAMARISSKAPIALRLATDLIDRGADQPLDQALQLELAHLTEIFSTKDAYEGLSSLGKKAPVFEGV